MMNGIGGSGDFAGNAFVTTLVTKSIAKVGDISSIVPTVSHVDHPEHDVDLLVTEQGLADLRGRAPRERALTIIGKCVYPMCRDLLRDYFKEALVPAVTSRMCLRKPSRCTNASRIPERSPQERRRRHEDQSLRLALDNFRNEVRPKWTTTN